MASPEAFVRRIGRQVQKAQMRPEDVVARHLTRYDGKFVNKTIFKEDGRFPRRFALAYTYDLKTGEGRASASVQRIPTPFTCAWEDWQAYLNFRQNDGKFNNSGAKLIFDGFFDQWTKTEKKMSDLDYFDRCVWSEFDKTEVEFYKHQAQLAEQSDPLNKTFKEVKMGEVLRRAKRIAYADFEKAEMSKENPPKTYVKDGRKFTRGQWFNQEVWSKMEPERREFYEVEAFKRTRNEMLTPHQALMETALDRLTNDRYNDKSFTFTLPLKENPNPDIKRGHKKFFMNVSLNEGTILSNYNWDEILRQVIRHEMPKHKINNSHEENPVPRASPEEEQKPEESNEVEADAEMMDELPALETDEEAESLENPENIPDRAALSEAAAAFADALIAPSQNNNNVRASAAAAAIARASAAEAEAMVDAAAVAAEAEDEAPPEVAEGVAESEVPAEAQVEVEQPVEDEVTPVNPAIAAVVADALASSMSEALDYEAHAAAVAESPAAEAPAEQNNEDIQAQIMADAALAAAMAASVEDYDG